MRVLGTILMILGANLIVGSVAFAFWAASFGCAMGAADGKCGRSSFELFVDVMGSGDGWFFWAAIVVGLLVFWRGKRMRKKP